MYSVGVKGPSIPETKQNNSDFGGHTLCMCRRSFFRMGEPPPVANDFYVVVVGN